MLPSDYAKRYDDSSKLIAFADSVFTTATNPNDIQLLASSLLKKTKENAPVAAVKTSGTGGGSNKPAKPEKLKLSLNASGNLIDVLDTLKILASKPLKRMDSSKIILTDTLFKPLNNVQVKPFGDKEWRVFYNFKIGEQYKLIIGKEAAEDSSGGTLAKTDTLSLQAKPESAYGSLVLRFNKIDTANTTVLQLIQQDEVVKWYVINKSVIKFPLFQPGDYELRILTDTNKNGKWDTGDYYKKRQPEKVVSYPQKLTVVANYDNEANITL
ncbi:MAG: hypothetical protein EAY72_08430 [Bacteroidetes bacterium]|nr:MAG: hypothetical protein EAY72_08430 [Bacteroidota bacterium]